MPNFEEYQKKAIAMYRDKKYSECIMTCDLAINSGLEAGSLYNIKSLALMAEKRYSEAAIAIEMAVRLSPQNETYQKNKIKIDKIFNKMKKELGNSDPLLDDVDLPDDPPSLLRGRESTGKSQIPLKLIGLFFGLCIIAALFLILNPLFHQGNANVVSLPASSSDYSGNPGLQNTQYNRNGGTQQIVYHTDLDGKIIWEYITRHGIDNKPVISQEVIYYSTTDGYLVALDATTGQEKWELLLNAEHRYLESPEILNGIIYVKDYGVLYAVDSITGQEIWKIPLDTRLNIFKEGIFFIDGNELVSLDVNTGQEKGRTKISDAKWDGRNKYISYEIIGASNGIVCIRDVNNDYNGIDLVSGQEIWNFSDGERGMPLPPVLSDGKLYAIKEEYLNGVTLNYLIAVDIFSGQMIWKTKIEENVDTAPVISNGFAYVGGYFGGNHYLYFIDAMTGDLKWKSSEPVSNYYVSDGKVFFLKYDESFNDYLHAVNGMTGQDIWKRICESSNYSYESIPGAIDGLRTFIGSFNGVLYIIDEEGNLKALDINTGKDKWTHEGAGKFTFLNEMNGVTCVELDRSTGEYKIYSIQ